MNGCKDHTPCPDGYMAWHSWAREKSRTHAQVKCGQCGLYKIWLPKAEAKIENALRRKEERKVIKNAKRLIEKGLW